MVDDRCQTVRNFLLSAIGLPLTVIRYRTGPYSRKQEGAPAFGGGATALRFRAG